MPEKRGKESKLAKAIAEAAVGNNTEKELDENFDDETTAKVSEYNENDEKHSEIEDDDDDWKLDFETNPAASTLSERSSLRTQNAPELGSFASDDRYKGKKVSRKSAELSRIDGDNTVSTIDEKEQAAAELGYLLEGGSDEDSEEDVNVSSEDEEAKLNGDSVINGKDTLDNEIDYGAFGGMSEDEGTDDEESVEEDGDIAEERIKLNNEQDEPSISITGKNDSNEYQKGLAIKSQMVVWDRLLEYRIQLQKVLQNINKFPQHDSWSTYVENLKVDQEPTVTENANNKTSATIKSCQSSLTNLLDLLLSTKTKLIKNNPELKRAYTSDDDDEISIDHIPSKKRKITDYESLLNAQHEKYITYRNDTIERWNDRTRIAMGSSNSTKGKQTSSFGSLELSTLKQIQHILSDTPRLVRRTQYKRTSYKVLGKVLDKNERDSDEDSSDSEDENQSQNKKSHEEYDSEIFDDDDFYHNLLRELIERKSGSDERQQDNWLQIQKLRAKSNRRKVDTRASKGRKIRYDIHAKLVNFMAPVVNKMPGQISEEAKNELFNSLFKS